MTADDCFRRFALDAEALRSSRDEDGTDFLRDSRRVCDLPPAREGSPSRLGRRGLHVGHTDCRRAVDIFFVSRSSTVASVTS